MSIWRPWERLPPDGDAESKHDGEDEEQGGGHVEARSGQRISDGVGGNGGDAVSLASGSQLIATQSSKDGSRAIGADGGGEGRSDTEETKRKCRR
jgi:hypothetical protein